MAAMGVIQEVATRSVDTRHTARPRRESSNSIPLAKPLTPRMYQQKVVTGAIIAVLVILIILVLWSKIRG